MEASSAFNSFKSKKILRSSSSATPLPSDQIPKSAPIENPATPLRRPGRRLMSVKDVREAAAKLHAPKSKPNPEVLTGSGQNGAPTRKLKKKADESIHLPDKYKLLCKFFDSLDCSLRLLRMKNQMPSLKNITPQIECLTDRRFSMAQLAQLVFILPEAVELKKVLVHDEKTFCMKPDLHVTLNVGAIKSDEDQKQKNRKPEMKSIFRARILDFIKAHPDEDVPEGPLPEPFNQSKINLDINPEKASSSTLLDETSTETILEQPARAVSHLPQTFQKRFSKQFLSQPVVKSVAKPITQEKSSVDEFSPLLVDDSQTVVKSVAKPITQEKSSVDDSQASVQFSLLPETPIKGIDLVKNKISLSEATPSKVSSTPGKLMSATPALPPPKRCYMTPDDKSMNSPNKLVRRPLRSRSLIFDTPIKYTNLDNNKVRDSTGDLSSDDDIFDILPESLVQSIREKELKIQEENDPAISQAKRRQQMVANLPKLFDMIRFSFQSSKRCLITKEELLHKLMTAHIDIIDRKEIEEQLDLLKELVPDLIYEKLASSGDLLIGIKKISSPELIRARLVGAE